MFRVTQLQGFDTTSDSRKTQKFIDRDIFYPPVEVGVAWRDSVSVPLTDNLSKWNGDTLRQVINASLFLASGTVMRLALQASSIAGFNVDAMYIGEQASSGDPYDMKASGPAPAQIKVGGSGSFSVAGNTTITTDQLLFTIDEAKTYVITAHFSGSSGDISYTSVAGATMYSKSGVNEAAIADVTGYIGSTSILALITKVQVTGIGKAVILPGKVTDTDGFFIVGGPPGVMSEPYWPNVVFLTGFEGGSSSTLTTFDPASGSGTSLSNGNRTATVTSGSFNGARSISYQASGKYYCEITIGTVNSVQHAAGIIEANTTFTDALNAALGCSETIGNTGAIFSNNSNTTLAIGAWGTGNNIGFAIDLTVRKCWFRRNGGLWNGVAGHDPTTGVGGQPIGLGNFAPFVGFNNGQVAGNNMTANFGSVGYTYSVPSGYGNWTIKLTLATDESSKAHGSGSLTGAGAISFTEKKFGASSYAFNGATSLRWPDHSDYNLGSGLFTVETFFHPTKLTGVQYLVGQWGGSLGWQLWINDAALSWNISTNGSNNINDMTSVVALTANTWHHACVDYDGSKYRLYLDGAMVAYSTTPRIIFDTNSSFTLGSSATANSFFFNGYLDETRITKDVARCGSDLGFVVPTAAYPRG